jgi:hypothetical protein
MHKELLQLTDMGLRSFDLVYGSETLAKEAVVWLRLKTGEDISFPLPDLLPTEYELQDKPWAFRLEIPKAGKAMSLVWRFWEALNVCLQERRIGRPRGRSKLTPDVIARIKRYKQGGRSVAWIAGKLKLSRQSVYTALKQG